MLRPGVTWARSRELVTPAALRSPEVSAVTVSGTSLARPERRSAVTMISSASPGACASCAAAGSACRIMIVAMLDSSADLLAMSYLSHFIRHRFIYLVIAAPERRKHFRHE